MKGSIRKIHGAEATGTLATAASKSVLDIIRELIDERDAELARYEDEIARLRQRVAEIAESRRQHVELFARERESAHRLAVENERLRRRVAELEVALRASACECFAAQVAGNDRCARCEALDLPACNCTRCATGQGAGYIANDTLQRRVAEPERATANHVADAADRFAGIDGFRPKSPAHERSLMRDRYPMRAESSEETDDA